MVEKHHTAAGQEVGFWPHLLEPLRHAGARIADFFAPSADAAAMEDSYEVNIELPGVAADDIEVELHDNVLSVHGHKRSQHEEKTRSYYFSERRYGEFHRSFRMPEDCDGKDISANFTDGVLTLRIPKTKPSKSKTRIPVKASGSMR